MESIKQKGILSVIVPVYNVAPYLEKAVNSILQQKYKNLELILIDDGSTDGSRELCQQFKRSDSRVRLIIKDNQGVSAARNDGLAAATGEYITFVDSDDWVELDAYEYMICFLENTKADICIMGFKSILHQLVKEESCIFNSNEALVRMLEGKVYSCSIWDKIYRRTVLDEIFFEEDISVGEDLLFNYQVFNNAKKIAYIPLWGYHYEQRFDSMINTFSIKRLSVTKVFAKIIKHCQYNDLLRELVKKQCIIALVGLLYSYFCDKNAKCSLCGECNEFKWAQNFLRVNWLSVMKSGLNYKEVIIAFLSMGSLYYAKRLIAFYKRMTVT